MIPDYSRLNIRVPFRQETIAGCVSYSLANLFANYRYLQGVEKIKQGERIVDANKKLSRFNPDLYVETLFMTQSCFAFTLDRLKDTIILETKKENIPEDRIKELVRPFLISYKRNEFTWHCILVLHDLGTDMYYIVDSKEEFIGEMQLLELINHYHITSVESFGSWEHENINNTVFFHKDAMPHIFPLQKIA